MNKKLSKIYLQIYGVHHLNPRGNFHFLWIGDFCIFLGANFFRLEITEIFPKILRNLFFKQQNIDKGRKVKLFLLDWLYKGELQRYKETEIWCTGYNRQPLITLAKKHKLLQQHLVVVIVSPEFFLVSIRKRTVLESGKKIMSFGFCGRSKPDISRQSGLSKSMCSPPESCKQMLST